MDPRLVGTEMGNGADSQQQGFISLWHWLKVQSLLEGCHSWFMMEGVTLGLFMMERGCQIKDSLRKTQQCHEHRFKIVEDDAVSLNFWVDLDCQKWSEE